MHSLADNAISLSAAVARTGSTGWHVTPPMERLHTAPTRNVVFPLLAAEPYITESRIAAMGIAGGGRKGGGADTGCKSWGERERRIVICNESQQLQSEPIARTSPVPLRLG